MVIDLRHPNSFPKKAMKMETLKRLRHLAKRGDWFFSFDLQDGFYALGVAPEDRQFFTVDIRGKLYQLAGLPMGWSLSPFCFQQLTYSFVRYFRRPSGCPAAHLQGKAARRWLSRRPQFQGARILPFVDDFAGFKETYEAAVDLRAFIFSTLDDLGLVIHPSKGHRDPVQLGEHLGLLIDLHKGEFRAPEAKLSSISSMAKTLMYKASANQRNEMKMK